MKRRVGKYKDKIIVEGDKNEFKSHEVSIKELAGTGNMGGGNDSNGINIEYYKVNNIDNIDDILLTVVKSSAILINAKQKGSSPSGFIGAGATVDFFDGSSYNIFAFGFIDKKTISILDGNVELILQGTLQERVDYFTTMEGIDKINIYDYIEPITEEEFYNISG